MYNNKNEFPSPPRGAIGPRVAMVSRLERCCFNQAVAQEGLFSGQHRIIMLLKFKGKSTTGQIAEELGVAASTVSVSIKRLEKSGFVKRKPNKDDARITEIFLTEKGEIAPENIRNKMESMENLLTAGFSEEEKNTLSDLLDKVVENFAKKEEFIND